MLKGEEDAIGRPLWSWSPRFAEIMGHDYYGTTCQDLLVLASIASELKNRRYGAQLLFIAATTLKRRASASLFWLLWKCSVDKNSAANAVAHESMQVIENALIMMSQTDGIQDADRMTAALKEMQKSLERQIRAVGVFEPEFEFLSAVRKFIGFGEKSFAEILQTKSEVKTKMHEVADFVCDTLNNGVDPDSEEFLKKLEMLRREIKDLCDRFSITIPPKQKTATAV